MCRSTPTSTTWAGTAWCGADTARNSLMTFAPGQRSCVEISPGSLAWSLWNTWWDTTVGALVAWLSLVLWQEALTHMILTVFFHYSFRFLFTLFSAPQTLTQAVMLLLIIVIFPKEMNDYYLVYFYVFETCLLLPSRKICIILSLSCFFACSYFL